MAYQAEFTPSPIQSQQSQHGSTPQLENYQALESQTAPTAPFHPGQQPPASDDGQDAKRRRIARACDMCRKKKVLPEDRVKQRLLLAAADVWPRR